MERIHRPRSVNSPVTSFVYAPPTMSPWGPADLSASERVMLRFKILASVVPLLVAAVFARAEREASAYH